MSHIPRRVPGAATTPLTARVCRRMRSDTRSLVNLNVLLATGLPLCRLAARLSGDKSLLEDRGAASNLHRFQQWATSFGVFAGSMDPSNIVQLLKCLSDIRHRDKERTLVWRPSASGGLTSTSTTRPTHERENIEELAQAKARIKRLEVEVARRDEELVESTLSSSHEVHLLNEQLSRAEDCIHELRIKVAEQEVAEQERYVETERLESSAFLYSDESRMLTRVSASPARLSARPQEKESRSFSVYYGTNRNIVQESEDVSIDSTEDHIVNITSVAYGKEMGELTTGVAKVWIPKHHVPGEVGSNWLTRALRQRTLFPEDDSLKVMETTLQDIWARLEGLWQDGDSLIFVHGFNVSFEGAVICAAQLGADLNMHGPTGVFSWPSKSHPLKYAEDADTAAAETTIHSLVEFLDTWVASAESGGHKVHLIAHSMGNRVALSALQELKRKHYNVGGPMFGQILFASPDVGVSKFRKSIKTIRGIADDLTLYTHDGDKALWLSKKINGETRAGHYNPVVALNGLKTVQFSSDNWALKLGHSFFREAQCLIDLTHMFFGKKSRRITVHDVSKPFPSKEHPDHNSGNVFQLEL